MKKDDFLHHWVLNAALVQHFPQISKLFGLSRVTNCKSREFTDIKATEFKQLLEMLNFAELAFSGIFQLFGPSKYDG